MKYPYYRFGIYRESKGAFREWFRHFVKLGIPCCIAKSQEGFALWRYGQESVEGTRQPNAEPIRGKIVIRSLNWPEEAAFLGTERSLFKAKTS